jgi:hypothetical protein
MKLGCTDPTSILSTVKLSLLQAVEANMISRQSEARWSALRDGRPLLPGRFLVLLSVSCVDPRSIVRLEGLGQLKNSMTSLGFEPKTFRLNQLRYRVPPILSTVRTVFRLYHTLGKNFRKVLCVQRILSCPYCAPKDHRLEIAQFNRNLYEIGTYSYIRGKHGC